MSHSTASVAQLCEAREADLSCIENMMQFYNYELSEWYSIEFDTTGLYRIGTKAEYWANPQVVPYLIRVAGNLAGFAVVDDEIVHSESAYSLGYFFVSRRYRGHGVGTSAFSQLVRLFPGSWELYHLARNASAGRFWPKALQKAQVLAVAASEELVHDEASLMYRFTSACAT